MSLSTAAGGGAPARLLPLAAAAVGIAGLAVEAGRVGLLLLVEGADLLVPAAGALAALGTGVFVLQRRRPMTSAVLLVLAGLVVWAGAGSLAPLVAGGTTGEYVPYRVAGDPVAWSLTSSIVVLPALAAGGVALALLGTGCGIAAAAASVTRALRFRG